jgi:hypothetical protein
MKTNSLDNPIFIFSLCLISIVINIISSINFFPILMLGVLFMAFFVSLKRRHGYSLFFVIITMLCIELNNGFLPFSIIMLSFFIYAFIIPYLKRVLSIENIKSYVYISVFYLGLYMLWVVNNESSIRLNFTLLINLILDFFVFGVFI